MSEFYNGFIGVWQDMGMSVYNVGEVLGFISVGMVAVAVSVTVIACASACIWYVRKRIAARWIMIRQSRKTRPATRPRGR